MDQSMRDDEPPSGSGSGSDEDTDSDESSSDEPSPSIPDLPIDNTVLITW